VTDRCDDPAPSGSERRRQLRRPTQIRAWADPGGVAPAIDCVVLDLSEGGANVMSLSGAELPDAFELKLNMRKSMGWAKVAWRNGDSVGVRLETSKPERRASDKAAQPIEGRRKANAWIASLRTR